MSSRKVSAAFLRFRESHHAIARMFAAGMTISMVAHKTGYTRRRLHLLLSDPSFQELVKEKAKSKEDKIAEVADEYDSIQISTMLMAARMLNDRVAEAEETGEGLSTRELLTIVKDTADRHGYGPKSTRLNINVDFASRLDLAIEQSDRVIEARAEGLPQSPRAPQLEYVPGPHQLERQVEGDHPSIAPVEQASGFPSARPSLQRVLVRR